jgi:uncharacterized protein YukJ
MSFINNKFDFKEMPVAFFADNVKANELRNQLIKNQVRISECEQGILEDVFFSEDNIDLINKQLIMSVYNKTKGEILISPQSSQSLIIVMRYIFLEYARHLPYDIVGQIRELNCMVVGEVLPKIITEATQRIDYLKEINGPRQINPLPIYASKGKRNDNPSISSIFTK